MTRKEKRELARQIAKAEEKKDYKKIEELCQNLSLEDMFFIDEQILKIFSRKT